MWGLELGNADDRLHRDIPGMLRNHHLLAILLRIHTSCSQCFLHNFMDRGL